MSNEAKAYTLVYRAWAAYKIGELVSQHMVSDIVYLLDYAVKEKETEIKRLKVLLAHERVIKKHGETLKKLND